MSKVLFWSLNFTKILFLSLNFRFFFFNNLEKKNRDEKIIFFNTLRMKKKSLRTESETFSIV